MNDREYYDRLASAYLRGRAERMSQEGPEIRAEGEKQEEKLYYFKRSPEKQREKSRKRSFITLSEVRRSCRE